METCYLVTPTATLPGVVPAVLRYRPLIEIEIVGELDAEPSTALLPGNLLLSHCDATVGIANVAFELGVHFRYGALESVTM